MSGLGMQSSLFALGIIEKYTNVSPSLVESPSLVFLQSQPAEEEQGVFANVLMKFSVLLQQLSTNQENVWIGNPRIFLENIFQNLSYYQSFLNKNTVFSSATQQSNTTVANKQIYSIQRQISTMRQSLYENAHHTTAVSQQTTAATIQHILQQYLQLSSPTLPNDQIRSRSPQINIKNTVFKTDQNNYTANRFYTQQQKNSYKTNALSVQQLSTQQTVRIDPPVVSSVQHLSWNKESKRSAFSSFNAKIYHHRNAFIALHDTKQEQAFFLSSEKYDTYRVQKNIELIRHVFSQKTNFFQQFMPNLVENTAEYSRIAHNLAVWYHQIQQHNVQQLYNSNALFEAYSQNILQYHAPKVFQKEIAVEISNNVFSKLLHPHGSENGRNLPLESFVYPDLVQKADVFAKEQQVIYKTDAVISNEVRPNYISKYDARLPQQQGVIGQMRSQSPASIISNVFTRAFSAVLGRQKGILPLMRYVQSEQKTQETAVPAVPTVSFGSRASGKAETVWNRYSMQQQAWNVFASRNEWSTQNAFYPMKVRQMQAVQQALPNAFYKRGSLLPVSYRENFVRERELLQRVNEKTSSEVYHISLQQNLVQENRQERVIVPEKSGTTNVIPQTAQNAVMAETVSAEKPAKKTPVPTAPTASFRSRASQIFPVVADRASGKAETVWNRYSIQQQAWNVFASRNEWSTQNAFYPMTVRQMQAVQQGLPNPFYKRESLLPVSYRENFVRERELLQRVTEKTNSEVYHISLQQNLVQENRQERVIVPEKSGTTNVIPKAAQNAVTAETVSAEKPAKETAVPTAPTTSFRSRASQIFPVVADPASGKAETVWNRYRIQQQAWNVFASRNEWSTQNTFYPMTVRQMQAVQQGLPNPFYKRESLLPVSYRERFVRNRELLQRVSERTNSEVYHISLQQNLMQENRQERVIAQEKSGTTNVIPKAAQNAVTAETVSGEKPAKEPPVSTAPTASFRSRASQIFPVVADQASEKAETVWNRYSMQQQAWNVFASRNEWSTQNAFYPMTVRQMQVVQQGLPNPFYKRGSLLPVSYRENFVRERELLQRVSERTNSEEYHISLQQNIVQENRRETIVVSDKSGTTNVIPQTAQNAVMAETVLVEKPAKETAVPTVPTASFRNRASQIFPVVADRASGKAETVWNRYSIQQQAWNVFASRNEWSTQNVFYPMTVRQMQAVQQGLPNAFYKRGSLLPVSYREKFLRERELLQRVTEKTNSEVYHISLQQNLVQENRQERVIVPEKSGTTNVIPKAAQNTVMAETVLVEKPAKETAVPTAPTASFRSRASQIFPVVADQASGKAETVWNRYSIQQQAWNVFASLNEWSTQNAFYPMTVRQMQVVQQGLPNAFYKRESLLPVSYREKFLRERELLQRVTEKTNNAVYHFTIGHIQHQVTPSTSQNFVKRDRDSSKDNQKWSVSNKQPAITSGQNVFYDEKSFVMVPYLQITPLLGQFPTLTTRHTETHTLFKNSIATTHKISEQAKQSFSLKNFVGKSVQSSTQQRQPKTAAVPQRSVLNVQKIDVPTVIFQKQAEKMHGTLSPGRASERSNEKSVPLLSVQPSRFTYPQTAAAQTAHRTTTFTPKHSTLPLAERKQPSANLPTSKLNPQKQNTEKNVTLLKKTLETQQQWSKFLVELEKSGASLVGNGVKELFSRNEFHRINQVMQQNVLVKMQNTTAYRNLLPSTNKITTIHHHLSIRSTAVEAAAVQTPTLRNRSGSSPFSYPDRGELSYRRTTQKQDAPPQQPTVEAQIQLRTIKKVQTEQAQGLEQQTGALKKLEKQLKQQEEQITQLMRRNSVSEPKIPSSHQLADQIMKEIQRQMRLERQRRGG